MLIWTSTTLQRTQFTNCKFKVIFFGHTIRKSRLNIPQICNVLISKMLGGGVGKRWMCHFHRWAGKQTHQWNMLSVLRTCQCGLIFFSFFKTNYWLQEVNCFNLVSVQAHWPMTSLSCKEGLIWQKNVEKLQLRLMVPFYLSVKSWKAHSEGRHSQFGKQMYPYHAYHFRQVSLSFLLIFLNRAILVFWKARYL